MTYYSESGREMIQLSDFVQILRRRHFFFFFLSNIDNLNKQS